VLLAACGGGGGGSGGGGSNTPPLLGPVQALTVNVGDGAISLGWSPPDTSISQSVAGYQVDIEPTGVNQSITLANTHAVVTGLSNGVTYTITVRAENSDGLGDPNSVTATPTAADVNSYRVVTIAGDPGSPSGIYDPSLLRASNDDLWLSYSSVNFYADTAAEVVQAVGTRIALSSDNGANFDYVATIAEPVATTITDPDSGLTACGSTTCDGFWVYETSFLIEDETDPDPDRRFKLFAHKYFLDPGLPNSKTLYHIGAIVMWTASSPDSQWSSETVLFGWPTTEPNLTPMIDISTLNNELEECLIVAEGSATTYLNELYFAFTCPYVDLPSNTIQQRIVLLKSTDHAASVEFVATLLTPDDTPDGVEHFSAPALIATTDTAPLLLATPVTNGIYAGSMSFPFASLNAGQLFTDSTSKALAIQFIPVAAAGHIGGASTYARGMGNSGVLQSDAIPGSPITATQFRIIKTQAMGE